MRKRCVYEKITAPFAGAADAERMRPDAGDVFHLSASVAAALLHRQPAHLLRHHPSHPADAACAPGMHPLPGPV